MNHTFSEIGASLRNLFLIAIIICWIAPLPQSEALPFSVGAPVPLDIERVMHGAKAYNVFTFSREGEVRPTILYGEASFMADRITFDEFSAQVTAIGNVRVTLGPQLMIGDHLEFNTDTRRGILTNAQMRADEISVVGGKIEIREIDVRDTEGVTQAYSYEIQDGTITACEYAIPHYNLTGDFFRVVPEIRVWLYGAVYRVLGAPIFYFPYLTRSLKKEPFAYVFQPAVDSDKGFILMNRFHLHYDKIYGPLARGTIYLDQFTKMGTGIGAKWNYLQQPEADSYIYGYYIDQKDDFDESKYARTDTEGERNKVAFQHFQRFNQDWTLMGKGRRLSDPDFDEDYEAEEIIRGFDDDELTTDRDAYLNLSRRRTNSNFRLIYKQRLDDFNILEYQEDERKPEVVYDSKRRPFDGTDLYHRFKFSAGNYASNQTTRVENVDRINTSLLPAGEDYDADIRQEFQRANLFGELNYPFDFDDFTAIPFASLEGTAYTDSTRETRIWTHKGEDEREKLVEDYDGLFRGIASTGVEFNTRRTLKFDDPEAAVEKRLLFEPGVTFAARLPSEDFEDMDPDSQRHTDTGGGPHAIIESQNLARVDKPGFPWIDDVESLRDEFLGVELRLDSRFQTRRANGRTRDWVIGSLSTAYDFSETETGEEPLYPVYAELFVLPFEWLTFSSFLEYESLGSYVRSFRNALDWKPSELATFGIAYSEYKFDEDSDSEQEVMFTTDLVISQRYTLRYQEHYDVDDSRTRLRRVSVRRDFHDWIVDVGFRESHRESRQRSVGTYFSLTLKTPKAMKGMLPGATVSEDGGGRGIQSKS